MNEKMIRNENNNFVQLLIFKHCMAINWSFKNIIWYLGEAIVALPGYQIYLASLITICDIIFKKGHFPANTYV